MKGIQKLLQYKIRKSDTLSSIARDNNLDLLDLLEVNKDIENPDVISADRTINIPERKKTQEFIESAKSILPRARDAVGRQVYPMYKKGAKYFGFDEAEQDKAFADSAIYVGEFLDKGALTNLKSRSGTRQHALNVSDDVREIVRHALLGYRIGDTLPKRIALQAKDATQAGMYYGYTEDEDFGSGPKSGYSFRNERGDLVNNRIGFELRKKYGDDERAAMEELMFMIARADEELHYVNKSNLVEKTFNPSGRRVM